MNEVVVGQHTEDIESLKKQIDEKKKEITELQKSRNQEIKALKARLGRLESEKKDLEDELRSVKVTVNRMEKDIKELALRQNWPKVEYFILADTRVKWSSLSSKHVDVKGTFVKEEVKNTFDPAFAVERRIISRQACSM